MRKGIQAIAMASIFALSIGQAQVQQPYVFKNPQRLLGKSVLQFAHSPALSRFVVVFKKPTSPKVADAKVKDFAQLTSMPLLKAYRLGPSIYLYTTDIKQVENLAATTNAAGLAAMFTAAAQKFSEDDSVKAATLDKLYGKTLPPKANILHGFSPQDFSQAQQWNMFTGIGGINVTCAGLTGCPSNTSFNVTQGQAGDNKALTAVIDSGIGSNDNLNRNIIAGWQFTESETGPVSNDDTTDTQHDYHGTHVAGVIAAYGPTVYGVLPDAQVEPVKVFSNTYDPDYAATSDIIKAIEWSIGAEVEGATPNAHPAKVLNLSLGGYTRCTQENAPGFIQALDDARFAGATIVAAAGNTNDDADNYVPAGCPQVITVAATARDGSRAVYSNYGDSVDLTAPGGEMSTPGDENGILSTLGANQFDFYQGTSMAAPHVAGVVSAMYLLGYFSRGIEAGDEIATLLKTHAKTFGVIPGEPSYNCGGDYSCGAGILNAYATLNATEQGEGQGENFDFFIRPPVEVLQLSALVGPNAYCPNYKNQTTFIATNAQFYQSSFLTDLRIAWNLQSTNCVAGSVYVHGPIFAVKGRVATLTYSNTTLGINAPLAANQNKTVYRAWLPRGVNCAAIDNGTRLGCDLEIEANNKEKVNEVH